VNPATALSTVLVDELRRCGLREAVVAPGSRSAPLAMALHEASGPGRPESGSSEPDSSRLDLPGLGLPELRLHVRVDERSAAFLALGLAKASGRPTVVVCTSGTAAANFHGAIIEADEAGVPLLVLTADRPPELRDTGANQTIDQVKLYGGAVRWFCEVGVPEARPGMAGYWRSLACRAWAHACGAAGGTPGPVHLNVALREPLMPGPGGDGEWPGESPGPLAGRADGAPWTRFDGAAGQPGVLELPWTERGVVVCGDGDYDPAPLVELAEAAGWPLLAEPSSNARRGHTALPSYAYLLETPEFVARHRPDVIVSAGRPGLSRGQLAFLRGTIPGWPEPAARHVVITRGPGRWADPARSATDVAGAVRLAASPAPADGPTDWLASWQAADAAASSAAAAILDGASLDGDRPRGTEPGGTGPGGDTLSEPRLARDVAALLPDGALLWVAASLPVRDLDRHMAPRTGLRVLASRGASGIDGLVSSAIGAALAHQAAGGGPAVALLGDLALLHDGTGLALGPDDPRPDLCLLVVNNDGGGIFSTLEPAAFPGPFERVFGTPHGVGLRHLAATYGLPYQLITRAAELPAALGGTVLAGTGLRLAEVRTDRAAGAELRAALGRACAAVVLAAAPVR
jgi:2-succinyl-5-enolpyruvyl-6-hydroxy-3-cyclohexene-1-carboxylate synthase